MLKKIKLIIASLSVIGLFGLSPATAVYADAAQDACDGIKILDRTAQCDNSNRAQSGFNSTIRRVINILSIVIGAVSVVMIIIGGFRYIVSGGDSSATKSAKDTIMYAVIGLVVVLFAQIIVTFVISNTNTPPVRDATPVTPGTP